MPSSTAELVRMTGMDTATITTANPSRKASDARLRVVPPPRGPRTVARSRCGVRGPVLAAPGPARIVTVCTLPTLALLDADSRSRQHGPVSPARDEISGNQDDAGHALPP